MGSPVGPTFAKLVGFAAFGERLEQLRKQEPGFAELRIDEQYRRAGPVEGIRVSGATGLELVLSEPYPQLLYWFTMPFTAPVPWEAVEYWDGEEGRAFFKDHPVGAGPFQIREFERQSHITLTLDTRKGGAQGGK